MRILYLVRHADKAWKNGRKPEGIEGYQHDPPLAAEASVAAEVIELLASVPFDAIYASPFLRVRQTLSLLFPEEEESKRKITLSPLIGEYLGNHRTGLPSLAPDTSVHYHYPRRLMSESIAGLEKRVAVFLSSLPTQGVFLIISHGLVLKKLCGKEIKEGGMEVMEMAD